MGDNNQFPNATPETIRERFLLYKQMGITTLRFDFSWRDMEVADGVWRDPAILQYMQIAKELGLRFKMTVGTEDSPPTWFLAAHPDAKIIDQDGDFSTNMISYWYPGIRPLFQEKLDRMLAYLQQKDLLSSVDYIIVPFGPAGEPIYPATWTTGKDHHTFWFYSAAAQSDFRQKMQAKYGTIQTANTAWGTSYSSWSAVTLPQPGTRPGTMWSDILTWYRDTKRDFISWQTQNYKTALTKYFTSQHKPQLIVLVPGYTSSYSDAEWSDAVATGNGGVSIKLMTDSTFLIQEAYRQGAILQYTGIANTSETDRLQSIMRANNTVVPLFQENEGGVADAGPLQVLLQKLRDRRVMGFDFISAGDLFGTDGITKKLRFAEIAAFFSQVQGGPVVPPECGVLASGISLAVNESIQSCNGKYTLVFQSDGNVVGYPSGTYTAASVLWATGTNGQSAVKFAMQADGNLVLYRADGSVVWALSQQGGKMIPSTSLKIQDDGTLVVRAPDGTVAWSSSQISVPQTKETFVKHLYACVLQRPGDASGVNSWTLAATSLSSLYNSFFTSSEYLAKSTSNQTFVEQLYSCVLLRKGDSGGVSSWVNTLQSGAQTRQQVIAAFLASSEFLTGAGASLQMNTGLPIK